MTALFFLFFLLAAIFFLLSAFGVGIQKINLLSLGLFFMVLTPLILAYQKL